MIIARVVLLALVLAALLLAAVGLPLQQWLVEAVSWAEQHRLGAGALFIVVYLLAAVLVLPGTILTFGAGFLFGLPLGAVLASVSSVLGSAAAFLVGRFVARAWVVRRIATWPRFRALDAATRHDGFLIVLLARLSPLIPYNLLNYGLSLTAVRFRDYVLATWIGMLPATVLYVYIGSLAKSLTMLIGGDRDTGWGGRVLLVVGFGATVALTAVITRRATRILRQRLAAEADAAAPGETAK